MLHVVFFIGSLKESGGTERVTTLIANKLKEKKYKITILSLYSGDHSFFEVNNEIKLVSLFKEKVSFKRNYFKCVYLLRSFIIKSDVDVFINVESMLTLYSIPASINLDIRNVCWDHFAFEVDLGLKLRRLARQMAALFCDDIITLTLADEKSWKLNTTIMGEIINIPNPSPFPIRNNRKIVKNKRFISVGRLTNIKGFDLLLNSWSIVLQERKDWVLRIVGSGEEKENLLSLAEDKNISDYIEWVSNTTNIEYEYENSDIYVLSSRNEGFPMVLLEAQSFGLPIIAFNCKNGPEEMLDSSFGFLCENGDVIMLANIILSVIEKFECNDIYESFSIAAITNCKNKYTIDIVIDKWIRFLESK